MQKESKIKVKFSKKYMNLRKNTNVPPLIINMMIVKVISQVRVAKFHFIIPLLLLNHKCHHQIQETFKTIKQMFRLLMNITKT